MKRLIVYFLLTITVSYTIYAQGGNIGKGISGVAKRSSEIRIEPYTGEGSVSIPPELQPVGSQTKQFGADEDSRALEIVNEAVSSSGSITTLNMDLLNPWGNNQPNLREKVIPSVQSTVRGLDTKNLRVSPTRNLSDQKNIEIILQKEEASQKRREKLREKVHKKIEKLNKMKTKGGIYMIYGHITIIYDNGEYYTNYAA